MPGESTRTCGKCGGLAACWCVEPPITFPEPGRNMIESEHHQAALTRIATLEAENARLREAITAALHETDAVVVKIRLRAALKGAPA